MVLLFCDLAKRALDLSGSAYAPKDGPFDQRDVDGAEVSAVAGVIAVIAHNEDLTVFYFDRFIGAVRAGGYKAVDIFAFRSGLFADIRLV